MPGSISRSETAKQNAHKKHLGTVKKIRDAIERSKKAPEVKDIVLSLREFSEYAGVARTWPYKAKGDSDHAKDYAALLQSFEGRNRDVEYQTQYMTRSRKSKWAVLDARIEKLKVENKDLKKKVDDLGGQVALKDTEAAFWKDKAEKTDEEIKRLRGIVKDLERQIERSNPLSIVPKDRRS